ncbi:MAG: glycoside hydrolase [Candidatus Omnitrophica bacterium]|nr:glycoside hydrolase [Candidatus Omnitrophota bacterium]
MVRKLNYEIKLEVVREGCDRKTEWFQPRAGILPPKSAVLTVTQSQLGGSDIFTGLASAWSTDLGLSWSDFTFHLNLARREETDGSELVICDVTPQWHAASGKLLATGHTARYQEGTLVSGQRYTAYTVYQPETHTWTNWKVLKMPDEKKFFSCGAGCTQRVDLKNGEILLPVYFLPEEEAANPWHHCYRSTVLRCCFDGKSLSYIEHGDELTVPEPRGLGEPSLTFFQGEFFLTLRNDHQGYVTRSKDGLHFQPPIPWKFDDGTPLGSYNTQQHWVTHSEGLYLVYTRRGANNDHIFRHRAPLFIAEVDPKGLCVLKETEKILVPERGAQLGNFGSVNVSPKESWVLTSEGMQGDAKNPYNIQLTFHRGANNRIYLCRLLWSQPNRLLPW